MTGPGFAPGHLDPEYSTVFVLSSRLPNIVIILSFPNLVMDNEETSVFTHEFNSPTGGVQIVSTGKLIRVRFPYCEGLQIKDRSCQVCKACK